MKKIFNVNGSFSSSVAIFAPYSTNNGEENETVAMPDKENIATPPQPETPFEEVYTKYLQRIISFAYSYLNDLNEAENVAHDVFISYWNARQNTSAHIDNDLFYLITATRNKCLNVIKKNNHARKYNATTLKEKTDYLNAIALESDSAMKIYKTDIEHCLNKAIEQMKPKVRKTFLLSRMSGLKNKEIALIEGIAESTVEARMSSALLILRRILKDYIK